MFFSSAVLFTPTGNGDCALLLVTSPLIWGISKIFFEATPQGVSASFGWLYSVSPCSCEITTSGLLNPAIVAKILARSLRGFPHSNTLCIFCCPIQSAFVTNNWCPDVILKFPMLASGLVWLVELSSPMFVLEFVPVPQNVEILFLFLWYFKPLFPHNFRILNCFPSLLIVYTSSFLSQVKNVFPDQTSIAILEVLGNFNPKFC